MNCEGCFVFLEIAFKTTVTKNTYLQIMGERRKIINQTGESVPYRNEVFVKMFHYETKFEEKL